MGKKAFHQRKQKPGTVKLKKKSTQVPPIRAKGGKKGRSTIKGDKNGYRTNYLGRRRREKKASKPPEQRAEKSKLMPEKNE